MRFDMHAVHSFSLIADAPTTRMRVFTTAYFTQSCHWALLVPQGRVPCPVSLIHDVSSAPYSTYRQHAIAETNHISGPYSLLALRSTPRH